MWSEVEHSLLRQGAGSLWGGLMPSQAVDVCVCLECPTVWAGTTVSVRLVSRSSVEATPCPPAEAWHLESVGSLFPQPRCLLKTYCIKKNGSASSPSHLAHTLGSSCSKILSSSAPASHCSPPSCLLSPLHGWSSSTQIQSPCPCHSVRLHHRGHQQVLTPRQLARRASTACPPCRPECSANE